MLSSNDPVIQQQVKTILAAYAENNFKNLHSFLSNQSVLEYAGNNANTILPFLGRHEGWRKIQTSLHKKQQLIVSESYELKDLLIDTNIATANILTSARCCLTNQCIDFDEVLVLKMHSGVIQSIKSYVDWSHLITSLRPKLSQQIIQAIEDNDLNRVRSLVQAGLDVNVRHPNTGLTALMMAACRAQVETVQYLVDSGADLFTTDSKTGATALHKACQGQNAAIAKILTDAGAFIDAVTPTMGHTPIMDALWYLAPDVVKHLVQCEPNLNTTTHYGFSLWDHLDYETNVQSTDAGKEIMARIRTDLEVYKEECQSRIKSQKIIGAIQCGDTEKVKHLIQANEDIEAVYPHVNTFSDGHNPLIIAARDNHLDIVRILIEAGANVDVFDWVFKGYPLHKATYNGRPDVLKEILKSSKITYDIVNVKGQINGYTPLIDALWHGFEECAQILLDHPMCTLGHVAHDGKNEYDVACQVFGVEHPLTQKIKGLITNKPKS